jgi:hypothetical protein
VRTRNGHARTRSFRNPVRSGRGAQIAVQWREEEITRCPRRSAGRPMRLTRPFSAGSARAGSRAALEGTPACWIGMTLAYDAGHEQPAVLELVHGGPAERVV